MFAKKDEGNEPEVIGRVDENSRVVLPIVLFASDGFELEMEATINLEFAGALVVPEEMARSVGWRCLGARRVMLGVEVRRMHHYLGVVSVGGDPKTIVALGGLRETPMIGQKLMAGRKLTVDFHQGIVLLK